MVCTIGCNDSEQTKYNSNEERITGEWSWIKTTGGFENITETPESTGETQLISFDSNGIYSFYKNDTLISEYNYLLGHDMTIFSQDSIPVIYINNMLLYAYHFESDDALSLSENVYDGFTYNYIRE